MTRHPFPKFSLSAKLDFEQPSDALTWAPCVMLTSGYWAKTSYIISWSSQYVSERQSVSSFLPYAWTMSTQHPVPSEGSCIGENWTIGPTFARTWGTQPTASPGVTESSNTPRTRAISMKTKYSLEMRARYKDTSKKQSVKYWVWLFAHRHSIHGLPISSV